MEKKRLWLKDIRKKLSLTQMEISEKLGISRSHYAGIENGIKNPSMELAENLSDYMGFDLNKFKRNIL